MTEPERVEIGALRAEIAALRATVDKFGLQMEFVAKTQEKRDKELDLLLKDHEDRIRSTERWKLSIPVSALLAIATVVGAVIGRG